MDQRSKNRIREHCSHWIEIERRNNVVCFNGPGVLMKCQGQCNWFGWVKTEALESHNGKMA
jgi:hypothetical protein